MNEKGKQKKTKLMCQNDTNVVERHGLGGLCYQQSPESSTSDGLTERQYMDENRAEPISMEIEITGEEPRRPQNTADQNDSDRIGVCNSIEIAENDVWLAHGRDGEHVVDDENNRAERKNRNDLEDRREANVVIAHRAVRTAKIWYWHDDQCYKQKQLIGRKNPNHGCSSRSIWRVVVRTQN